ncbi:MAG: AarF/UbiB family protein [Nitrospirae bacterium YQR-1]
MPLSFSDNILKGLPDDIVQMAHSFICGVESFKDTGKLLRIPEVMSLFKQHRETICKNLIEISGLCECVPQRYEKFRPIVYDGAMLLLAGISVKRFMEILLAQEALPPGAPVGERLLSLSGEFPMLHKLGQIVARNPEMDKHFSHWLIKLENSTITDGLDGIKRKILRELGDSIVKKFQISPGSEVLSQASVASVVDFTWVNEGRQIEGVFKTLRPGVSKKLKEEVGILDKMAEFFVQNREKYEMPEFKFIETFADIKEALLREIYLINEQVNLKRAKDFYKTDKRIRVPEPFHFSVPAVTAMERIRGVKVTEAGLNQSQKKKCAGLLFDCFFFNTLFSTEETAIFHGDPHAGNIFLVFSETAEGGVADVALLDWSLTGELTTEQRAIMLKLVISIALRDRPETLRAVQMLSSTNGFSTLDRDMVIGEIMESFNKPSGKFIEKALNLLDVLSLRGIKFPTELLLFRKAIFTLNGLLQALDDEFDMDNRLFGFLLKHLPDEIPQRWFYSFFPYFETREAYKTMLTNAELLRLGASIAMETI